tara:strand:+ start:2542 stop:3258 length:717 start_codon:yes stop_codon:yes gene_type:complete
MNVNSKLILGFIYIVCLGILLFFVFSYLDFKDFTDYQFIKKNSEQLLDYKEKNLLLFIFLFSIFSILWVFFLGFAFPIAIISGFLFGQWYGALISTLSFTVGSTLLYLLARHYFYQLIVKYLEEKIRNYKSLFKKNEFFYFMIFRFVGGGGTPFAIQNVLPVIFDMKVNNYFYSTLLGLVPGIFIANSLGSGIEGLIEKNESLSYSSIIFDPGIYWPIIGFALVLAMSFFIKKILFKK